MPQTKIKARCDRVRQNNGMTEVFFTRVQDEGAQEEYVLMNIHTDADPPYKVGAHYFIRIQPAFPH